MDSIVSHSEGKLANISRWSEWLKSKPRKFKMKMTEAAKCTEKVARDDPRRLIHAIKVGIAVTLVSTLYYYRPLYDGFGVSGMWAVLTVVVVFEYTVGATLSKGLNRGIATFAAGSLGVGAARLADLCGGKGEPILLGLFVFILAALFTMARFIPAIKAKYDYGVMIFILTFSMVAVSGFRVDEILLLGNQRLCTILIGAAACIAVSLFVCPVWAGEELNNLIAVNLKKLSSSLEELGNDSFWSNHASLRRLRGHESILNSKANEDSLANFAAWEPAHGHFRFRHPWNEYVKVGALTRKCACLIEGLNSCLNQMATAEVLRTQDDYSKAVQEYFTETGKECGMLLQALSEGVMTLKDPSSSANHHVQNLKSSVDDLKNVIQGKGPTDFLLVTPTIPVAFMLAQIVVLLFEIADSVGELSKIAHFQAAESTKKHKVLPVSTNGEGSSHVILDIPVAATQLDTPRANGGHAGV